MNKRFPIVFGLLLLALALWLRVTPIESVRYWVSRLDSLTHDIQLRAQLLAHGAPHLKTSVVIVDIDNKSVDEEGRWPWSHVKMAQLVNKIQAEGAVVIAFDMTFTQSEQNIADTVFNEIALQNLVTPPIVNVFKQIAPFFDYDTQFLTSLTRGDSVVGLAFLLESQTQGVLPP